MYGNFVKKKKEKSDRSISIKRDKIISGRWKQSEIKNKRKLICSGFSARSPEAD